MTGLSPDYAEFSGAPYICPDPSNCEVNHEHFGHDAWRVACNIAMDYAWFGKDQRQVDLVNKLLQFFYSEGLNNLYDKYKLDVLLLINIVEA